MGKTGKLLLWSKVLKVISIIFGIIFCLIGFLIGIVGIGPDGFVEIGARLAGVIILVIGIVDCLPNQKLLGYYKPLLFFTLLPYILIVGSALMGISVNLDKIPLFPNVILFCLFISVILLPGPLSLLLYKNSVNNQINE